MAKRFTDTEKWKKLWFQDLPPQAKLVWFYLLDNCDHAGVWPINFKLLSFQIGFEISQSQFNYWFGDKTTLFENDKFFIPSFVDFQYGKLNSSNNAHLGVIKTLERIKKNKPLTSPCPGPPGGAQQGAQDKDKDMDKDKDQEQERGGAQLMSFEDWISDETA